MALLPFLLIAAFLSLSLGRQIRQVSEAQFQASLVEQRPTNMLITGANRARGMKAMARAKRYVQERGCNTHVCFALDAGVYVSAEEYALQQDFATLVAAVAGLDERFAVAGVQYGLRQRTLTRLTRDVDSFLTDVDASTLPRLRRQFLGRRWRRRSRRVFARTLRFCAREVGKGAGVKAKKIVFLGDMRSPRGGVSFARRFIPPVGDGAICAVGFGRGNKARLERFTGDPDRVLGPKEFSKAIDILEEVVRNVCGPNNARLANSLFTESVV